MFSRRIFSVKYNPSQTSATDHGEEVISMCQTCRQHHPELYTDKPASKPEKEKEMAPKKKVKK